MKIKDLYIKVSNFFIPAEDIRSSKKKWDSLAQKDAKYFVWTQKERISEEELRASGKSEYDSLVANDVILQQLLTHRDTALDMGCGVGRITEFMDFEKVYGVDISVHMVQEARVRLPDTTKFSFLEGDGVSLPIQSESVDFVFSHAVFHHMPTRKVVEQNFKEVFRILKPGGLFKVQLRGTETSKRNWFYGVSYTEKMANELSIKTGFSVVYNRPVIRNEYKKSLYLLLQKPKTR